MDELFRRAKANGGYQLEIDLPSPTVRNEMGLGLKLEIDDFRRQMLLNGLDEIGPTLGSSEQVREYERTHHSEVERHSSVDFTYSAGS